MKANKRIRDLRRRSDRRLFTVLDGVSVGTTKYPWDKALEPGFPLTQRRNNVQIERRAK